MWYFDVPLLPLSMTHGAAPSTEQSSLLSRTPLMQQFSLSKPPALPQPGPPHWPHAAVQQTEPRPLVPSIPTNPLLQVEATHEKRRGTKTHKDKKGKQAGDEMKTRHSGNKNEVLWFRRYRPQSGKQLVSKEVWTRVG